MKKVYVVLLVLLCISSLFANDFQNRKTLSGTPTILLVMPDNFGANFSLNKDNYENLGYRVITTALTKVVQPCPWAALNGLLEITVDSTINEITSFNNYDAIVITSGANSAGDPMLNLMNDTAFLNRLKDANSNGVVIAAYCTAVRVLAAADLINNKRVTGHASYVSEFTDAGATYMGSLSQPVIDGNIVTSVRGDYYYIENSDAVDEAIERRYDYQSKATRKSKQLYYKSVEHPEILWYNELETLESAVNRSMVIASNNYIYTAGYTYNNTNGWSDISLIKYDDNGNILWEKSYGAMFRDYAYSIIETGDEHLLVCGTQSKAVRNPASIYLMKVDMDGNLVWEKNYGGGDNDRAKKVISLSDGNYLLLAETMSEGEGEEDVKLLKINTEGNVLWEKVYGFESSELPYDVIEMENGEILFTAASGNFSDKRDVWLVKTNSAGEIIWSNSYGAADDNDWGFKVITGNDGTIYITGKADKHGKDFYCASLIKTDENGSLVYYQKYGKDKNYEFSFDVSFLNDTTLVLTGVEKNAATYNDFYFVTVDTSGKVIEEKCIEAVGYQWVYDSQFDDDGNLVCVGQSITEDKISHPLLFKIVTFVPDFDVNIRTGHAPLDVKFSNKSVGQTETFSWDFNNDGNFESNEVNPAFTYNTSGIYSVALNAEASGVVKNKTYEKIIKVFDGESCASITTNKQSIIVKANPQLNFTDQLTFECRVNPLDMNTTIPLFKKGDIELTIIGNSIFYDYCIMAEFKTENGSSKITTPKNSIIEGDWCHISFVYHKAGIVRIFINGEEQELKFEGDNPGGYFLDNTDKDIIIGNEIMSKANPEYLLDEIRIWKLARSREHIISTYDKYLHGNEDSLKVYLKLNEGNGSNLVNSCTNSFEISGNFDWEQSEHLDNAVSVKGNDPEIKETHLFQNYPNPFNPSTKINYNLAKNSYVEISLYSITGEKIRTLFNAYKQQGSYLFNLDMSGMASGIYFYQLCTGEQVYIKKLILLK